MIVRPLILWPACIFLFSFLYKFSFFFSFLYTMFSTLYLGLIPEEVRIFKLEGKEDSVCDNKLHETEILFLILLIEFCNLSSLFC